MGQNVRHTISAVLQDRNGFAPRELHIDERVITGGLEASSVTSIEARYLDRRRRRRTFTCIAKQLQGPAAREASIYRQLLSGRAFRLAPEVFRIEGHDGSTPLLLLEDLSRMNRWPWRDIAAASSVLHELAAFHNSSVSSHHFPAWDYEHDLQLSAITTLEQLGEMRDAPEWSSLISPGLRATRRLVSSLSKRRAALLQFAPFDNATLHGDLHPGNVLLRENAGQLEPVLIDWARARTGSALEDVSSWLQSLGYWEPEARRRHDTLLKEYLRAKDGSELSSDVRAAYWMAGASNALAGALRYHCWRAAAAESLETRRLAAHCARDWLRVSARADALSA